MRFFAKKHGMGLFAENDDYKLQTKFGVHINSNIFKIIQF